MKSIVLSLALIFGLASIAQAEDISFSYVDLQFLNTEIDGGGGPDPDGDGFGVRASYEFVENIYATFEFAARELEFDAGPFTSEIDLNTWSIGAGYIFDVADATSVYGQITYENLELDAGGGNSGDESGFGAKVGVRNQPMDSLELGGYIRYFDIGGEVDLSETALGVMGMYHFNESFSVGVDYEFGDDIKSQYSLFGRFNFGAM